MHDMNDIQSSVDESASDDRVEEPRDRHTDGSDEIETLNEKRSHTREIGGRKGLDPVRYGDWEKNGRCIDF